MRQAMATIGYRHSINPLDFERVRVNSHILNSLAERLDLAMHDCNGDIKIQSVLVLQVSQNLKIWLFALALI